MLFSTTWDLYKMQKNKVNLKEGAIYMGKRTSQWQEN